VERKIYDRAAVSFGRDDLQGYGYSLYPDRELDWVTGRLGLSPRTFDYGFLLVPRKQTAVEPDWDAVDHVIHCESSVDAATRQLGFPGEMQLAWYVDLTGRPREEFDWVNDYLSNRPRC
jgi:hypothetical protein